MLPQISCLVAVGMGLEIHVTSCISGWLAVQIHVTSRVYGWLAVLFNAKIQISIYMVII